MKKQNRREFIKLASLAVAGSVVPVGTSAGKRTLMERTGLHSGDTLNVGLIGCGGRGTGAASQALSADANVALTAVADIFPDRIEESLSMLKTRHEQKVQVPESNRFVGFDAYQSLLDTDVDVVILTAPPGFRPKHLEASVHAGVHIFCEKPVAVDAAGIRSVFESVKKAKEQKLSIVSGFCWRYHYPKRAFYEKIQGGAVGDIRTVYNTYNTGAVWFHDRQPEWTDQEFQLRNWLYYTWLSGDHIVEQAVHSVDFMNWAMGDELPVSAVGTGGRQVRTEPQYGHVYDHFAITYEYANGARGFHFSRQQANCENSYKAEILGSEGTAYAPASANPIIKGKRPWEYDGESNDMYQTQHDELFDAIRNGRQVFDGEYMANSTMLAIMGRMAAYTGRKITWEEALNSSENLMPDHLSWEMIPDANDMHVAMPGVTPLV